MCEIFCIIVILKYDIIIFDVSIIYRDEYDYMYRDDMVICFVMNMLV